MNRQIGPYEIVEELGRGGMGIVYKAREESLQRFVAIKMLGNQLTENDSVVQRFMREARAVADVNHPNLVQVFRVDKHDGQPYFAMEYVEGESLKDVIQREQRMQPVRALQILKEVAAGLAAAHDKGVVHRDIKPENIMLTRFGGVKVVDFGIARVEEPGTRLTTTGIGLGTPSYLSPEVCLSQDVDARSDIFSLGVVLFEMLTGEIPFKSDSPFELMTKVVEAKIPDIKALNPNVDDGARQILAKMIAKRPKLRYQNCNELISDIEDYRAGRVPRWARTLPPESATEVDAEAAPSAIEGEPDDPAEAETTPMSTAATEPALETAGATGVPENRPTEAVDAPKRPRRRAAWAVAAALVLLTAGGAGAAWVLLGGQERPWDARFGSGGDAEVVARGGGEARRETGAQSEGVPVRERDADAQPELEPPGPTGLVGETGAGSRPGDGSEQRIALDSGTSAATPAPVGVNGDGAGGGNAPVGAEASGAGFEFTLAEPDDANDEAARPVAAQPDVESSGTTIAAATGGGDRARGAAPAPDRAALRPGAAGALGEDAGESPSVVVVAVGDPAVAGPVARALKRGLDRAAFDVFDEQLLDGLVYAESLAGVARTARDGGADVLVYADVVPTGERELEFYGRRELQQLATLEVRIVDLRDQRNLGRPVVRDIEYVALTAGREAQAVARPVARNVVNRLRALRAMRGPAQPG